MSHREHIQRIKDLPHTRNVTINTVGNYVGYAFTAFFIIFLVRTFDPVQFGVLTVLQAFSYLLANVLSFGLPASIYAHVPELLHDKKKAFNFISANFLFLTMLSGGSLLLLYVLAPQLDSRIFKTGAPQIYFAYALLGTQFFIWQNFVRDILNAAGKFLHINIASNVSNVVKAGVLIWLAMTGNLGIAEVLIIMGIVGPLIVFLLVFLERKWIIRAFLSARPSKTEIRLRYTFSYFLASQVFNLATRADLFLVAYFLTKPEVGFYGLSQRIVLAVITSSDSITQVMSAQFAKATTQSDIRKLLKHSYFYMLVPTAMFLGGIFMPNTMYELVFSSTYASSTLLTRALSFAYIPYSFLAALLLFFLYTVRKPSYIFICNTIFLISILIGNAILVPHIRLFGPAVSYFSAFMIITVYLRHAFSKEIQRLPA